MNNKHILALALTGLMTTSAFAQDAAAAGELLDGINMFTPAEGDPAYKVTANEKYGTQWAVDMAYGYWTATTPPRSCTAMPIWHSCMLSSISGSLRTA